MGVFENKKALIIGGSGGIGAAIAKKLALGGAELTIHGGHKSNKFDSLVDELEKISQKSIKTIIYNFFPYTFDELSESNLLQEVKSADIICICFGPFLQKRLDVMTLSDWKSCSLLDYALPGLLVSSALPNMMQKRWGRILVFGGTGTEHRKEFLTNAAYAGAKAGLGTLVQSVAACYADYGITCNALLPGFTKTEYTGASDKILEKKMPLGTLISAESVADAAFFLLSNPDLNGAMLRIDRGWSPIKDIVIEN